MTALSHRLARAPLRLRWLPARGFERALTFFGIVIEAFAESREMQRQAHRRYPFTEW